MLSFEEIIDNAVERSFGSVCARRGGHFEHTLWNSKNSSHGLVLAVDYVVL